MATELLSSCGMAMQKIKRLYIASRKLDGNTIDFPIEYTTISGSSDSIIRVTYWNEAANICTIGGQTLEWREVSVFADYMSFTEEYQEGKQGKLYVKKLNFELPRVNYQTNAALKEFLFTADGEFAVAKVIAFIIDENDKHWICGEKTPLILQGGLELSIAEANSYKLSFQSLCTGRSRIYQIQT
jgi:hypothetical protein